MPKPTLREIISDEIKKRLDEFDGNRARTAESLGVTSKTVRNHIERLREDGEEIPPGKDGQPRKDDDENED